jgi:hypothetical protein
MSRWLVNLEAVRTHFRADHPRPRIRWWASTVESQRLRGSGYQLGEFIGQGRRLHFCYLSNTVLDVIESRNAFLFWNEQMPERLADRIMAQISRGPPPLSWRLAGLVGLAIVWIELGMAFWVDLVIPPVGVGCWSVFVLVYAVITTVTWVISQIFTRTNKYLVYVSHIANTASVLGLMFLAATVVGFRSSSPTPSEMLTRRAHSSVAVSTIATAGRPCQATGSTHASAAGWTLRAWTST